MRNSSKLFSTFLILITITFGQLSFFVKDALCREVRNVILIGWDGVQRRHFKELFVQKEEFPNLKKLLKKGELVNITIKTGETSTKPGWTEILTGYSSDRLRITTNREYKPIPKGFSVFERLKKEFGEKKFKTIFIGGKINNIGSRGPHEACLNCLAREGKKYNKTKWWSRDLDTSSGTYSGGPKKWVKRKGEPHYHSSKINDVHKTGLGPANKVGKEALKALKKHRKDPFFAFIHFEEPDEQGHRFGENSKEYDEGLRTADRWLGKIVKQLKSLGIYDKTTIFVTSDHGFDEGSNEHFAAPYTFFASNDGQRLRNGDRKDVAPTIYEAFGIKYKMMTPKLDGRSLYKKNKIVYDPEVVFAREDPHVKIGYFQGGRVNMIYRTHTSDFFQKEGVEVELYSADLRGTKIIRLPDTHKEFLDLGRNFLNLGKMRGTEIVDLMTTGVFDAGTIGESSFIKKIEEGHDVVAVALLGYEIIPGKAFIIRKGVKIDNKKDFFGKILISRRGGAGDYIFTMEFFKDMGIKEKDINLMRDHRRRDIQSWIQKYRKDDKVNLIPQVHEDGSHQWIEEGIIDGGFYHLLSVRNLIDIGKATLFRPFDWMNSELSLAILVFNRKFIKENPEQVQKVVTAYVRRVKYEKSLPEDQLVESWDKGTMMKGMYKGMSIPQYTYPPKVRLDLLNEIQDLLVEYKFMDHKLKIEDYVDNSFVEKAYEQIEKEKTNP